MSPAGGQVALRSGPTQAAEETASLRVAFRPREAPRVFTCRLRCVPDGTPDRQGPRPHTYHASLETVGTSRGGFWGQLARREPAPRLPAAYWVWTCGQTLCRCAARVGGVCRVTSGEQTACPQVQGEGFGPRGRFCGVFGLVPETGQLCWMLVLGQEQSSENGVGCSSRLGLNIK